ncbi:MAG: DUF3465 domain-containing protein [Steroidobacteraceae bacterium]
MKKLLLIAAAIAVIYFGFFERERAAEYLPDETTAFAGGATESVADAIAVAYSSQRSDVQVRGDGTVSRLLDDDNDGSRHQRFIVQLASGQTVLVSHNIDLAPRIDALRVGDHVSFNGEYEWNDRGGVVHWTHHDPQGRHEAGWVRHQGQTYQ